MESELAYLLWLLGTKGIGYAATWELVRVCGSASAVYHSSPDVLLKLVRQSRGLRLPMAAALSQSHGELATVQCRAREILTRARALGIGIVTLTESMYPLALQKAWKHSPPVLYYRGNLQLPGDRSAAVVGTRHPSGRQGELARRLGRELANRGWNVVSGLALGIDRQAHLGALEARGSTIAVLGCGLDRVYPRANKDVFDLIAEHGLLVSEYPPGTPPSELNLRRRNRTIVAFSDCVVMAGGDIDSGAMIAVGFAEETSKPIYSFSPLPDEVKQPEWAAPTMLLGTGRAVHADDLTATSPSGMPGLLPRDEASSLAGLTTSMRDEWLGLARSATPDGLLELVLRISRLHDLGWHKVASDRLPLLAAIGTKKSQGQVRDLLSRAAGQVGDQLILRHIRGRQHIRASRVVAVLFDLDGVLVDTREAIATAFRSVLGEPLTEMSRYEQLQLYKGSPGQALRRQLGQLYTVQHSDKFGTSFLACAEEKVRVVQGIHQLLDGLLGVGLKTGVVTSRPQYVAQELLRLTGLSGKFDVQVTWRRGLPPKPSPAPLLEAARSFAAPIGRTLYVGDTPDDLRSSQSAGAIGVAATWASAHCLDELLVEGPIAVVAKPEHLASLLL